MERFTVGVSNSAKKNLKRIPQPWHKRIIGVLDLLEERPFIGTPMQGKYKGTYKVRVWPYRIIYNINTAVRRIEVHEIGHRGGMPYR